MFVYNPETGKFHPEGTPEELAQYAAQQQKKKNICSSMGAFDKYYQECILDNVPKSRNEVAVGEAAQYCSDKYLCSDIKKKKAGFFGISSAHECFLKYGAKHPVKIGAELIHSACYDLYPDN